MGSLRESAEVVVIGGGPGGYVAALRAADLGKEVLLIEERERLGGVCLLEGCIPSKTLIHVVQIADEARRARAMGLTFENLRMDPSRLREFTDGVVDGLSKGIATLVRGRGIEVIHGRARLAGPNTLQVEGGATVDFQHCIIATGSHIAGLPMTRNLPVWSSTEALALPSVPQRLVVVGGGYIGLELGLVYAGLSSWVTMVDLAPRLLPGADADLVDVMIRSGSERFHELLTDSRVIDIAWDGTGFKVEVEHQGERRIIEADQVLVAVGRRPNTDDLGLEEAGIRRDAEGRIPVNAQMRTVVPSIFAIGDVVNGPMLAHKASREGKVAAEVIAGHPAAFDDRAIPAVVYTDPEIAWVGLTEREAAEQGVDVKVGRFPLRALGRARTLGRADGMVKVIAAAEGGLILGMGMVGPMVSELITEGTLAIEMGATLEDLMGTIHPHPSMAESVLEAAEAAAGTTVHLPKG